MRKEKDNHDADNHDVNDYYQNKYMLKSEKVCFDIDGRVQSAQQTDDSKSKETFTSQVN